MSSLVFFLIFIPILSLILLLVNFIFAPHKPYREKKTPFECGYHSFLAQNRNQFTILFFIFALLFLIFDIEIVLIYPFTVSSYFNKGYGYFVALIFILILALGFVYEIGKNALKIDTKQVNKPFGFVKIKHESALSCECLANFLSFITNSQYNCSTVAKLSSTRKDINLNLYTIYYSNSGKDHLAVINGLNTSNKDKLQLNLLN